MLRSFVISSLLISAAVPAQAASDAFYKAVNAQQWGVAMQEASGPMKTYVEWNLIRDPNEDISVDRLRNFLSNHPDWPYRETMQARVEKLMFQQGASSAPWPPVSGYGQFLAARNGDKSIVRSAWISGDFEFADEVTIMREFGSQLTQADHQARIERLLAADRATIAERLLDHVDDAHKKLYRARIGLIRKDRNVDGLIDAVPSSMKNDPWLQCERVVWRKQKGLYASAIEGLRTMKADNPCGEKVWKIRAEAARDDIEAGKHSHALELLKHFGPLQGGPQAEMLWLRGWLQFAFLKNYSAAYDDFLKLYQNVTYPISKSRGAYWAARAADKMGNSSRAQENYRLAAGYPTTFYGQLAYAKVYPNKPLGFPSAPSAGNVDSLLSSDMMRVVAEMVRDDQIELANPLIAHLGENADTPNKIATLAAAMKKLGAEFLGVRASKFAAKDNLVLLKEGWPTTNIPESALEPALPHAIARQESEFNKRAVSSADARGLMQLLPSTAKRVAKTLGMEFTPARLFEPSYNATLGSHYLASLVDQFNGSYILAIAGYNAGPGRSVQWIQRFGRPGRDVESTIQWIESIPFSETRNYVQRVLENTQTYRAVMNPSAPLAIEDDLLR